MNQILAPLAIVGFVLAGSQAFSDDVVSEAGMAQQHKAMKDCMAKHASSSDRMTRDDMERACKEEIKSKEDKSNAMSSAPQK